MQIARDWTDFWGFDGYFRCLCDIFGGIDGEGINKLENEDTFMSQRRYLHKMACLFSKKRHAINMKAAYFHTGYDLI